MPLLTFQPDPATADAILQAIAANYSLSLTDIAARHNTTIEALTAWLTRDDIDERLSAIESACARRARLTAANHLPAVAHVAKQALEEASDVLRLPPDYRTHHSIALRIRATESARRAAALLLRIANFAPGPRRIRHHDAPTTPRVMPPPAPAAAAPTARAQSAPIPATPNENVPSAVTPTVSAPCAPPFAPVSLPPTECAPAAPAAAPRTETAPSAPTSATTSATPTDSPPTPSASSPLTNRAQSAPTSLPPAESTPSEPTSATSAACTTPAPHAANPRHIQFSAAIADCLTLAPVSASPAPLWPPAPNAHPPPRTPSCSLSPSASSRVPRA